MSENGDIHALAGAYALDAVDDVERAAFDRHLRECMTCNVEVAEMRETSALLSHPVAIRPPSELRTSVLQAISSTPQERHRSLTSAKLGGLHRWRRLVIVAVAASFVLLGAIAGTWTISEQRLQSDRLLRAQIDSVLRAPDMRLTSSEIGGGHVNLLVSHSQNAAVVVFVALQPPGRASAYQMWIIGGRVSRPISVGLLPAGAGDGQAYIGSLHGGLEFAISRESAKGADLPNSAAIVGKLSL